MFIIVMLHCLLNLINLSLADVAGEMDPNKSLFMFQPSFFLHLVSRFFFRRDKHDVLYVKFHFIKTSFILLHKSTHVEIYKH